jgi:mono/diheme cytochrome c family protein
MAEEVEHSSQHWTGEDLKAVATYLKDGPDVDGKAPTPIPASDNRMTAGREIYADRCSACHMPNGEGVSRLFPKLSTAPLVNANDPASLVRVVLAGSKADGTQAAPTGPAMPSFAWNLSDENVADVLTFVRNSWGNAAPAVKGSDVEALRTRLQE